MKQKSKQKIEEIPVTQRVSSQLPAVGAFSLMPCAKDVCQKCAVKHDESQPHNHQSLYWQYWFFSQYGRWPTWADAMKHCADNVKSHWIRGLKEHGITVPKE